MQYSNTIATDLKNILTELAGIEKYLRKDLLLEATLNKMTTQLAEINERFLNISTPHEQKELSQPLLEEKGSDPALKAELDHVDKKIKLLSWWLNQIQTGLHKNKKTPKVAANEEKNAELQQVVVEEKHAKPRSNPEPQFSSLPAHKTFFADSKGPLSKTCQFFPFRSLVKLRAVNRAFDSAISELKASEYAIPLGLKGKWLDDMFANNPRIFYDDRASDNLVLNGQIAMAIAEKQTKNTVGFFTNSVHTALRSYKGLRELEQVVESETSDATHRGCNRYYSPILLCLMVGLLVYEIVAGFAKNSTLSPKVNTALLVSIAILWCVAQDCASNCIQGAVAAYSGWRASDRVMQQLQEQMSVTNTPEEEQAEANDIEVDDVADTDDATDFYRPAPY